MVSDLPYLIRERRETRKRKRAKGSKIQLGLGLDMSRRTEKNNEVLDVYILDARMPRS